MMGKFVVHPDCIIHGQRPEVNEGAVRPMKGGMEHVGPGHVGDGLYSTLCDSIFMVGTNAAEA